MTSRSNPLQALSDNIKIDKNRCTFCGECVERCILDNLRMRLAPCRQACPLGVNAQAYVQLIARGQDDKAREMVLRDLPFPAIVCRICDHPCEKNCHRLRVTGQAVSIRALKRYLFDGGSGERPVPPPASGQRVAVIGAGPAGLTAAFDLAVKGHQVVVHEAEEKPGGLMRWAIPAFRLPLEVLDEELESLQKLGITFRYRTRITCSEELEKLETEFDAVIIAAGLGCDRRLGIEGEDFQGVYHAMSLLRAVKKGLSPNLAGRVVVIGGGNSAVDAGQTALRLGAERVTVISLESRGEMPAFTHEICEAEKEGVVFDCSWGPSRFVGKDGQVQAVVLQRCLSVFDQGNKFNPRFDACHTAMIDADAVIVAIGQAGGTLSLGGTDQLKADPVTLQTDRPKVFLAGDCESGPSSVIRAMASGRQAALSVDRLLKGEDLFFNRTYAGPSISEFEIDIEGAVERDRIEPPVRDIRGEGDFAEVEGVLTAEQARQEAERCYSCGRPEGHYRSCWFCLPCEVVCPEKALWVEIPYLLR